MDPDAIAEADIIGTRAKTSWAQGAFWPAIALACLGGLLILGQYDYLTFHGVVETISVVVAGTIFSLGWNCRSFVRNNLISTLR